MLFSFYPALSFFFKVQGDWDPKSKGGPGRITVSGPVVSPGSNFDSGPDISASEMQRDPAFALAVGSLERCLSVRERVGSSLIVGRLGKPSGSGGFGAAVCEKEFKGPVSDFQGVVSGPLPSAVAPVEVVRRSGAVGGSAIRPISAGRGSVCAVGEALGVTSKLGSHEKDGFVSKVRGLADGIEGGYRSALGQRGHSECRDCACDCS